MTREISTKKKAQIAHNIVQEIKQARKNIMANYLVLGKKLCKIQEETLWASYGEHLQNFEDFVKELHFKRSTAYNLMGIWKEFGKIILEKGFSIGYTPLTKLLPVVRKEEEKKEEWLEMAEDLPPRELEKEISESKGHKIQEDCSHPFEKRTYFFQCGECRKWVKIENPNKENDKTN